MPVLNLSSLPISCLRTLSYANNLDHFISPLSILRDAEAETTYVNLLSSSSLDGVALAALLSDGVAWRAAGVGLGGYAHTKFSLAFVTLQATRRVI